MFKGLTEEGFIEKSLPWSMKLLYKPYDPNNKSGFEAYVYRFKGGDVYSKILRTWALWDGVRCYDFYEDNEPTASWELSIPTEHIVDIFKEVRILEKEFCNPVTDEEEDYNV